MKKDGFRHIKVMVLSYVAATPKSWMRLIAGKSSCRAIRLAQTRGRHGGALCVWWPASWLAEIHGKIDIRKYIMFLVHHISASFCTCDLACISPRGVESVILVLHVLDSVQTRQLYITIVEQVLTTLYKSQVIPMASWHTCSCQENCAAEPARLEKHEAWLWAWSWSHTNRSDHVLYLCLFNSLYLFVPFYLYVHFYDGRVPWWFVFQALSQHVLYPGLFHFCIVGPVEFKEGQRWKRMVSGILKLWSCPM